MTTKERIFGNKKQKRSFIMVMLLSFFLLLWKTKFGINLVTSFVNSCFFVKQAYAWEIDEDEKGDEENEKVLRGILKEVLVSTKGDFLFVFSSGGKIFYVKPFGLRYINFRGEIFKKYALKKGYVVLKNGEYYWNVEGIETKEERKKEIEKMKSTLRKIKKGFFLRCNPKKLLYLLNTLRNTSNMFEVDIVSRKGVKIVGILEIVNDEGEESDIGKFLAKTGCFCINWKDLRGVPKVNREKYKYILEFYQKKRKQGLKEIKKKNKEIAEFMDFSCE